MKSDVDEFDISILNQNGEVVLTSEGKKGVNNLLHTEALSSGVYMIRLTHGSQMDTFKVMKP